LDAKDDFPIPIFRNEINALGDFRGGVKVARDFAPLHFTAFHPDWKLTDTLPTSVKTLRMARKIAMNAGIRHVYTGNVHDPAGQATHCHACGAVLIGRNQYDVTTWNLTADGRCAECDAYCHGVFEAMAGRWGQRRQPVRLRRSEPEPVAS
jgi:pyruvate formate lyase activating enzyme